jgi:hypothetical protein
MRDLKGHKSFSPLWKHCQIFHNEVEVDFVMTITGKFKKAMPREQNEGVRIKESPATIVLNSKAEWDQPPIIRVVPIRGNRFEDQIGAQEVEGQGTGAGTGGTNRGAGRGAANRGAQRRGGANCGADRGAASRGGANRGGASRGGANRGRDSQTGGTGDVRQTRSQTAAQRVTM